MRFKQGKFRTKTCNENVFFTADEHFSHYNAIKYSNRPFKSVEEMNETLINNHNSIVGKDDITFHLGDFTLLNSIEWVHKDLIDQLNGEHIFLKGSHDYWMKDKNSLTLVDLMVDNYHITLCHYCLRTWPRSHYNSWHLYGHSHGGLPSIGKSHDVGVDNNNYYPFTFDQIKGIMKDKDDNFNLIER